MKNKKILYVYTGGHIIHEKFARTVTKNFVKFSSKLPKGYDIYFFEGEYAKPVLMRMFRKIDKKAKIICLFSDPRLFYLKKRIKFDYSDGKIKRRSRISAFVSKKLLKRLDGAMCAGKWQAEMFKEYNKKAIVKVIYPFIEEERYKKLIKIKPSLKENNILFIGNGPDYYVKGMDILIEVFKELKEEIKDLRLNIIGEWKEKKEWNIQGVNFLGKIENINNYLKSSTLGIHLGKGEGFGVNILEFMSAGIPVICSEFTGAKEFVEKSNKEFVVPINKTIIKERIKGYFALNLKERQRLSKKFRKNAKNTNEKVMLNDFKIKFNELVKEIYKNE